jgi:hypothetical protein
VVTTQHQIPDEKVLRQLNWTDDALQQAGFTYYEPIKRLLMARIIKEDMNVQMTLEVLTAQSGDIIIYDPGDVVHENLDDYEHWPVRADLFKQTYERWNYQGWKATPPEQHLLRHGCFPYYKAAGIWALNLPINIYVQSLESPQPIVVPRGRWLCIGSQGEPYHMSDEDFRARYVIP